MHLTYVHIYTFATHDFHMGLFAYSGVQHIILCCVCVLFVSILCALSYRFLWIVHFDCPFGTYTHNGTMGKRIIYLICVTTSLTGLLWVNHLYNSFCVMLGRQLSISRQSIVGIPYQPLSPLPQQYLMP